MRSSSLSHRISLISRLQRKRFDARARGLGMTLAQWRTIHAIHHESGATQRRIAEIVEVGDVSASRLIDRLVANDWVERRPDPTDRRAHRLFLTALAEPLLDRLGGIAAEEERLAVAGIDDGDTAAVLRVLDRMIANLELQRPLVSIDPVLGLPNDHADDLVD